MVRVGVRVREMEMEMVMMMVMVMERDCTSVNPMFSTTWLMLPTTWSTHDIIPRHAPCSPRHPPMSWNVVVKNK